MKKQLTLFFTGIFLFGLYLVACKKKDEYANLNCSQIASAYNANIKPIISAHCLSSGCHGTGSANGDFTTYAGLKAAADNGQLDSRVLRDKNMPPSGALSTDDRDRIKCWLNNRSPNN